MGVGTLAKKTYYSISNGSIVRQFKEKTEHSRSRINKMGKEVHEEFYEYISGIMTGITTKDHPEFGRSWVVTFQDGKDEFVLQMSYSSGYSQAFLKMLPNVDVSKKVTIIPKVSKNDAGKNKATLFINQGGKAIKWFYTKDDPNGLPALKSKPGKGAMKGKTIYDDSEIMDFLEEMVKEEIVPKLPQKVSDDDVAGAPALDTKGGDEDAPF